MEGTRVTKIMKERFSGKDPRTSLPAPALDGLTVLDLTRRYPGGAYTAMFLADFGADVIKIDPHGSILPIPGIDTTTEEFAAYFPFDRNKRSIILNLKHKEGLKIFYQLVKKADVLIEGFRPGVMRRLKADYETLRKINPRLVYCSLSGYGQDGPYASKPGHDMNYCAIAGALSLIGNKKGSPCLPSNYLADMAGAGLHGLIGILIALLVRNRMGEGQYVDVTYLEGVLSLMVQDIALFLLTGEVPKRGETFLTGGAPWGNVYRCKDGEYIALGCAEPHFWENLCRALGKQELIPYHNPAKEHQDEVVATLQQIFITRTRDEWEDYFKDKDTCVSPVKHIDEVVNDPQVVHRGMILKADHPKLGSIRQPGFPIKLSETPAQMRSLGVPLGFHTDQFLMSLGYSKKDISRFREIGAIG